MQVCLVLLFLAVKVSPVTKADSLARAFFVKVAGLVPASRTRAAQVEKKLEEVQESNPNLGSLARAS